MHAQATVAPTVQSGGDADGRSHATTPRRTSATIRHLIMGRGIHPPRGRRRRPVAGIYGARIPSCSKSKAQTSVCSATTSLRDEPIPSPARELTRSSTGRPGALATWSRAVILRECAGFTRPSCSPVVYRTPPPPPWPLADRLVVATAWMVLELAVPALVWVLL